MLFIALLTLLYGSVAAYLFVLYLITGAEETLPTGIALFTLGALAGLLILLS